MAELKVALEVAQQDFEKMCIARRVELDETGWSDDDKESFAGVRLRIVKAISSGKLTIDDDGDPTFVALSGKSFKLKKANGAAIIAQDGKIGGARIFAALAELTGCNVGEFAKLEVPDVNVLSNLYALFFQRASSI